MRCAMLREEASPVPQSPVIAIVTLLSIRTMGLMLRAMWVGNGAGRESSRWKNVASHPGSKFPYW